MLVTRPNDATDSRQIINQKYTKIHIRYCAAWKEMENQKEQ